MAENIICQKGINAAERNRFMKRIIKQVRFLPIVLPIVFTVIFFGYLPPRFDVIVYTNNIVGEGVCSTYISSDDQSFVYLYQTNAYFGSELKTLRIPEMRYNINEVSVRIYNVKEADILSFDFSVFGHIVTHLNKDGVTHPFQKDRIYEAVVSTEEPILHMDIKNPEIGDAFTIAGLEFIPQWIWFAYSSFILIIAAILSVGFGFLVERFPKICLPFLNASTVMTALILGTFLCGSMPYVNYTDFLLNWLLLFALSLIIGAVTDPWIGTATVSGFTVIWYIANYFVISFRGKPIMPSDLRAIGTAKEVADGYNLTPNWQMIVSIIIIVLYCVANFMLYRKTKNDRKKLTLKKQLIGRSATVVIAVLMIVFGINNPAFARLNSFQWDAKVLEGFHREGIVLTFAKSAMSAHVTKPEGYSREVINGYIGEYEQQEEPEGIKPVNIIMVMNEAFADLRTVGMDERIDVMPYIDSLQQNTIEGRLYTSVFGGGTCNTEFEALTGNTLAFLGTGAYPYTENVNEPLFSIAQYFKDAGYTTEAFHANEGKNWNRNRVYPLLGFDVFHDIRDYTTLSQETTLHSHPADIADYLYMEEESAKLAGQPRFLFSVTMQNHADYDHFEDVKEAESIKAYGANLHETARVYLSLVKASDDEISQLIETYQNSDEPTMIVFFGDHQPGLKMYAQEGIYINVSNNIDGFKTKFFIWTNYETEAIHDVDISANYLPWLILKRGNFKLPPYIQMLKEVHEKYPVISSQGVIDKDGNVYGGVAEVMDDPLIRKYQQIQYANLFDKLDVAWFQVE